MTTLVSTSVHDSPSGTPTRQNGFVLQCCFQHIGRSREQTQTNAILPAGVAGQLLHHAEPPFEA